MIPLLYGILFIQKDQSNNTQMPFMDPWTLLSWVGDAPVTMSPIMFTFDYDYY